MANKRSFVISDPNLLQWIDNHTEENCRTNGVSAITRQLISLGIVLYEKGFRINEMGQLLKQVNSDEIIDFVMQNNNNSDKNSKDDLVNKFQKFAHV